MPGHFSVALELPQASSEDMARLDHHLGTRGEASFDVIGFVTFADVEALTPLDAVEVAFERYIAACRVLELEPCPLEMVVE